MPESIAVITTNGRDERLLIETGVFTNRSTLLKAEESTRNNAVSNDKYIMVIPRATNASSLTGEIRTALFLKRIVKGPAFTTQAKSIMRIRGITIEIRPAILKEDAKGKYFQNNQCTGVRDPCIYRKTINRNPHIIHIILGILTLKHLRVGRIAAMRNIAEPPKTPCISESNGMKKLFKVPRMVSKGLSAQA